MDISQYLETSGKRASALAKSVGVSPAIIYQWRTGLRPVPIERCAGIEAATGGAVTRKDLRPNDWQKIWPDLQSQPDKKDQNHDHANSIA